MVIMKRLEFLPLLLVLWFILIPLMLMGQPKSGHFIYEFISCEIIDSSIVSASDAITINKYMKGEFYAEFYFNQEWVVAVLKKSGGIEKRMYHRKSRVLYIYYDQGEIHNLKIDSIQALKRKDKGLLEAIDSLKSELQVIEYRQEKRRIAGFSCHKVTAAGFDNAPTLDEIWVAKFRNVPNLIFPDALYFLIEGIPIEVIQDLNAIKFKWGVVDILPVKPGDDIFKQRNDGYEILVDDTSKLIYESIDFSRTY